MNEDMTVRTDAPDTAATDIAATDVAAADTDRLRADRPDGTGVDGVDRDDYRILDPENDDDWEAGDLAEPHEIPADPPRRFMLREYGEEGEPSLFLWGVEVAEGAIGFDPDGTPVIQAGSAEGALRVFGMVRDLDLLWLDPPTEPAVV